MTLDGYLRPLDGWCDREQMFVEFTDQRDGNSCRTAPTIVDLGYLASSGNMRRQEVDLPMKRSHIIHHRIHIAQGIGVAATIMTEVAAEGHVEIEGYVVLLGIVRCIDSLQIVVGCEGSKEVCRRIACIARHRLVVFLNNVRLHGAYGIKG